MKEKKKRRKVMIGTAVVLAVCGIAAAVVIVNMGSDKAKAGERKQGQNTVSLARMDLTKSVSATGTIQSKTSKTVSAQVNGVEIKQVKVSVGDSVKKGDVLVTFDESDLQEALSDAQENLADTRDEAARNLSNAREQLNEAEENYQDEKEKLEKQVSETKKEWTAAAKQVSQLKKQVKTQQNSEEKAKLEEQLSKAEEMEKQAENAYETAVSNRENTNKQNKRSITTAQEGVQTAQSNQKKSEREAQKQVREAKKALQECAVTAPISGVITASNVEEGDTYSGGSMFQIDDTTDFVVSTSVDEYDISSVKTGQRVVVLTEATGEDEIEGEITFVAPSTGSATLSSGNAQSSETAGLSQTSSSEGYEVEITLQGENERLRLGLTARCSIILEEAENVYAVPYDAVHEKADGTTVIQVSEKGDASASTRELTVTKGMESDYYVEISGDELSEGLSVIIPTDETVTDDEEKTEQEVPGGMFDRGGAGGEPPSGNAPGDGGGRPMGGGRND